MSSGRLKTEVEMTPVALVVAALSISSPGFQQNAGLPAAYTCDGAGTIPALQFSGVPAAAAYPGERDAAATAAAASSAASIRAHVSLDDTIRGDREDVLGSHRGQPRGPPPVGLQFEPRS